MLGVLSGARFPPSTMVSPIENPSGSVGLGGLPVQKHVALDFLSTEAYMCVLHEEMVAAGFRGGPSEKLP